MRFEFDTVDYSIKSTLLMKLNGTHIVQLIYSKKFSVPIEATVQPRRNGYLKFYFSNHSQIDVFSKTYYLIGYPGEAKCCTCSLASRTPPHFRKIVSTKLTIKQHEAHKFAQIFTIGH